MGMSKENIENKELYNNYEINSWEDLEIKKDLLRGIYSNGFENPSPIQKKAILPIIQGNDVIAQAQSGTGKTGCFSIAGLELIDTDENHIQVLILSPTRELSHQTKNVIDRIGINMKDLKSELLVGGTST